MCDVEPIPADAKVKVPGLALAAATRSATVLKPLCFEATSTFGCAAEHGDRNEIAEPDRTAGCLCSTSPVAIDVELVTRV